MLHLNKNCSILAQIKELLTYKFAIMVQVDYPAKASYFLNENAIIRTYKFWATIKCFFTRRCYFYPVVYTDGLLSYVVADGEGRTPWGIALGDYIVAINAPEEEMSICDAHRLCNKIVFAGRKAGAPSMEIMRYIIKNAGSISDMFVTLGGTPLHNSIYITDTNETSKKFSPMSIDFRKNRCSLQTHYTPDDKIFIRPAVDISSLYH